MSAPEEDTEMAPVAEEVDVPAADENDELDYEPSTEKTDKVELPSIRRRKVRETFGGGTYIGNYYTGGISNRLVDGLGSDSRNILRGCATQSIKNWGIYTEKSFLAQSSQCTISGNPLGTAPTPAPQPCGPTYLNLVRRVRLLARLREPDKFTILGNA